MTRRLRAFLATPFQELGYFSLALAFVFLGVAGAISRRPRLLDDLMDVLYESLLAYKKRLDNGEGQ